jgi:hypothetical protein
MACGKKLCVSLDAASRRIPKAARCRFYLSALIEKLCHCQLVQRRISARPVPNGLPCLGKSAGYNQQVG